MPTFLSCSTAGLVYAHGAAEEGRTHGLRGRMTPSDQAPDSAPPNREEVDTALLQRVARGDRQAFAELYDRFSPPLYGTALRIVREPAEAQDVVHDAFMTLWEKASTFDASRGNPFAWAVTLVRNRSIDRVRMRRRRAELLADSLPDELGYTNDADGISGADRAASGDEARAVRAAVAALPAEQQRALELAFFSGLTQEEIARTLREPLGTVKARIRRGLIKLRDILSRRP